MVASVVISTALAEIREVTCGEGYTEYYGSLCGANFYILIPDDWTNELGDGMLVVICRPGAYFEDPREWLEDYLFAQELAMNGIALAASNYGPDAYEFAKGKPLTLLTGSNLLHLLEKHGHKATIDLKAARKILSEREGR